MTLDKHKKKYITITRERKKEPGQGSNLGSFVIHQNQKGNHLTIPEYKTK